VRGSASRRGTPAAAQAALLTLVSSLTLAGVRADGCPPIVLGAAHGSLDELAARTLNELFDEGGRYESGGFLIERDGKYHASRPVTQRGRRAVSYCIVLPRDARLAGLYHTHVASSALSAQDRSNAERAGVPTYIGTIRDRSMLVYDARLREARLLEHGSHANRRAAETTGRSPSLRERFAALQRRAADAFESVSRWFR
jgi:hypothetical protein